MRDPGRLCATCALLLASLAACDPAERAWNATPLPDDFPRLALGLTGESASPLTRQRLDGYAVLLVFGYTACPDVCPATLARLDAALSTLEPAVAERFRVVFVSVDPRRDDPARLARYTSAFGPRFIGATGPERRLRELANRFGLSFSHGPRDGSGDYTVNHPAGVFAFDARGRARLLIGRGLGVDAITADLRTLAPGGSA